MTTLWLTKEKAVPEIPSNQTQEAVIIERSGLGRDTW